MTDVAGRRTGEEQHAGHLRARIAALEQLLDVHEGTALTYADQLAEKVRTIETLHRIGSSLTSQLELEALVQAVTDAATSLVGAQFGAFFYNVEEASGGSYLLYSLSGAPKDAFARFPLPRNTAVFSPTFRGEAVVRLDDVTNTNDDRFGKNPPYYGMPKGHLPVRSYLAVPVVSRSGEVLGGLFFGHEQPGVFDESDEWLTVGVAAQAAIAIENARLYQAAQAEIAARKRTEEAQHALAEASRLLIASAGEAETLAAIARLAVPSLADACAIGLVDDIGFHSVAVAHVDDGKQAALTRILGEAAALGGCPAPIASALELQRLQVVSPDHMAAWAVAEPDEGHLAAVGDLGFSSIVVVPLVARGRSFGAVSFLNEGGATPSDAANSRLYEDLGGRIAVGVDNARLYRERSRLAEALQDTLLPPLLPEIPGMVLAASYRASGAGNVVGGDFYDVFQVGPNEWAVVLGDVSGTGPEAAALTGLTRYTVRAVATHEHQPSRVLADLNLAMMGQRSAERFCSAVYLRLQPRPDGAHLLVACGGHPPPVVVRRGGGVEVVEHASGDLLGLFEQVAFNDVDIRLAPGDAVVLYTDGVVEARSADGGFFDEARLLEVVAAAKRLPASAIARRLDQAVLAFQGSQPADDAAIVVIQAAPGAGG